MTLQAEKEFAQGWTAHDVVGKWNQAQHPTATHGTQTPAAGPLGHHRPWHWHSAVDICAASIHQC